MNLRKLDELIYDTNPANYTSKPITIKVDAYEYNIGHVEVLDGRVILHISSDLSAEGGANS